MNSSDIISSIREKSMKSPSRVLVLEGSLNSSLAVVRSLGRMGAHVTVGDHHRISPALFSRYAKRRIRYPNPEEDKGAFLNFLEIHLRNEKYDLVFPMSDFTVVPIAQRLEKLSPYAKFAIAPLDQLLVAHDKAETIRVANSCGVGCPMTIIPESLDHLEQISNTIAYPVVVKPRSKVSWVGDRPFVYKVTNQNFVSSKEKLISLYQEIHRTSPFPLIQEVIEGEGFGFFALMAKGIPKAIFGHRRLREYPLSGGTSSYRESYLDQELEEQGRKILEVLQWDGVAMVEFKRDKKDGSYKLMEINGRWWGSLPLAVAAGVDFPRLYSLYLLNGEIESVPTHFPKGLGCRALLPWDLLWLMASLSRPGRGRALAEFFKPNGLHFDILSISDPLPTIGACALMLSYLREVLQGKLTIMGEKRNKEESVTVQGR